jgi:excisionase family DNA binding protein|tara:strand:+ start:1255 stop:1440 length:186 start_codon:yes stop_codon:yes gene_type:complete
MNEEDRLLLSVNDAMRTMSISRRTFYGLINSGELESLKIGRKRLIPKNSIEKYIHENIKKS